MAREYGWRAKFLDARLKNKSIVSSYKMTLEAHAFEMLRAAASPWLLFQCNKTYARRPKTRHNVQTFFLSTLLQVIISNKMITYSIEHCGVRNMFTLLHLITME